MVYNTVESAEGQLIRAAQAGDRAAQTTLYQKYSRLLYGYLYKRLGCQADAEDITQEAFLRAFKYLGSFQGQASFKNWLFQITKNLVADHWQAHYSHPQVSVEYFFDLGIEPASAESDEQQQAEQTAAAEQLQQLLAQLPDDYRAVLEHRFLRGYTIQETAIALNITVANAKIRQYRALQKAKLLYDTLST